MGVTMISFRRKLIVGAFALAAEGGVTVTDLRQAGFVHVDFRLGAHFVVK